MVSCSSLEGGGPGIYRTSFDQFGSSPADGNYLAIRKGESMTLGLDLDPGTAGLTPVSYFGLHFTAGDGLNSFDVKSGGVTIATFNTADLLDLIPNTPGTTVTSIGGTTYNTEDYFGQPVTGNTPAEPFAYLHIIATEGTTFDELVLSQFQNNDGGAQRFESDNHSIRVAPITTLPPELIDVTNTIPEPSAGALALAVGALLGLRRKRA